MTENVKTLIELCQRSSFIDFSDFEQPKTPSDLMANIIELNDSHRTVVVETRKLLGEWLYPMLDNPAALTKEQAQELYDLAQALFQPQSHVDTDLALRIYEVLVAYARAIGDKDALIRNLYWLGLSLYYLNKLLFNDELHAAFSESASYRSEYTSFASNETRYYINRSLGNVYVAHLTTRKVNGVQPFFDAVDEAWEFWNDPQIREFDQDIPFDRFIYSVHQNVCTLLDQLRTIKVGENPQLAERVYESAVYVYENAAYFFGSTQSAHTVSRLEYTIWAAKYHSGRMPLRELAEKLLELSQKVGENEQSLDTVFKKTHIAMAAVEYFNRDETYDRRKLAELAQRVNADVISCCSTLTQNAGQYTVNTMLAAFVDNLTTSLPKAGFLNAVLGLTVYRHMPTYVHSLMVSWIAELICDYFCEKKPEFLIGLLNCDTAEQVREKRAEIIGLARLAGLCHDVGKCTCLNTIATYGRPLSDREFAIIRTHPDMGYELLQKSGNDGIADVAHGHHIWYDGTKGYPTSFNYRASPFRPLIEIICVCDSIDAATDLLGRAYAVGLTLDKVMGEIYEGAGTRYSPDVAEALRDPILLTRLEDLIHTRREEAYFTAFSYIYTAEADSA